MSRIGRDPAAASRNFPTASPALHRRGRSLTAAVRDDEDLNLDLFAKHRAGAAVDGNRKSVEVVRNGRSAMEDLLDAEMGKNDYDWLLTPPGTPHVPLSATSTNENSTPAAAPKRAAPVRSVSTSRTSRLSSFQTENGQSAKPVRSSSLTRGSVSSNYTSNHNRTSVLNTSSASVTSRPSTPGKRPTTPSTKSSTPISRSAASRSQTPTKPRPATSSGVRTGSGPLQNSRPATPTSRITTSSTSSIVSSTRPASRSSTPTRAPSTRTISSGSAVGRSPSVGRTASKIQTPQSAPSSRASSPSPRPRAPVRPIDLPDFPNDTPPNLRTKMPERPLSAGRSRPGAALTVRASPNGDVSGLSSSNRRTSVPIVSRSKFPENPSKVSLRSNGHQTAPPENQKASIADAGSRKTAKPASTTESTGFGRNISKKSLDMALRHMDIRQSLGGIRGASLFPHSIRSATSKAKPARLSDPVAPATCDEIFAENDSSSGTTSGDVHGALSRSTTSIAHSPDRENLKSRDNDLDLYSSYRYGTLLLREDLKSTNWLHSVDDKSDQSSVFDHRFEPLPEPFDPLL